jgi:hypothetical protein
LAPFSVSHLQYFEVFFKGKISSAATQSAGRSKLGYRSIGGMGSGSALHLSGTWGSKGQAFIVREHHNHARGGGSSPFQTGSGQDTLDNIAEYESEPSILPLVFHGKPLVIDSSR